MNKQVEHYKQTIRDYIEKENLVKYINADDSLFFSSKNKAEYFDYFFNNWDSWKNEDKEFLIKIILGNSIISSYLNKKDLFMFFLHDLIEQRIVNATITAANIHNDWVLASKIIKNEEAGEKMPGFVTPAHLLFRETRRAALNGVIKNLKIMGKIVKSNPLTTTLSFLIFAYPSAITNFVQLNSVGQALLGIFLGTHFGMELIKTANHSFLNYKSGYLNPKLFAVVSKIKKGRLNNAKKLNIFSEEINNIKINFNCYSLLILKGTKIILSKMVSTPGPALKILDTKLDKIIDKSLIANFHTPDHSGIAKYNDLVREHFIEMEDYLQKFNMACKEEQMISNEIIKNEINKNNSFMAVGEEAVNQLKEKIVPPQDNSHPTPRLKI